MSETTADQNQSNAQPSSQGADASAEAKCLNCGADSSDRVLLPAEYEAKRGWVCVRCLPHFIHGSH